MEDYRDTKTENLPDDRNKKALKSGFWYIFANIVVRGITLISTPIFARMLTHGQYGAYSNYLSWTGIVLIVLTMRLDTSLISAKFDYADHLDRYNRSIICLTAVMVAVGALVTNVFSSFFGDFFGFGQMYTNMMMMYCFFHAVINLFQINERYQYRYKRSVVVSLLVAVSTMATSILLILQMDNRLTGRVFGGVLPIVVIGVVLFGYFFKNGKDIDFSAWPYALKICLPYVPHLLSLQVLGSMDRIMITHYCGAEDNALYTVAYICGRMVVLLMTAMNSAFAPWLGDQLNEGKLAEIQRVSKYYSAFFTCLSIGMMLLAPEVLLIMGGKSYLEATYVMTPVAMGCICQFIYTLYVNVEQFKKKTVGMAFASATAALLNYGLNLFFIPRYGYIAAAYTTLVGYVFLLVIHMIMVKKLKVGAVYDDKFFLVLVAMMSIVMLGINVLYGHPMLRYTCFGGYALLILGVCWYKRDVVRRLFAIIIH